MNKNNKSNTTDSISTIDNNSSKTISNNTSTTINNNNSIPSTAPLRAKTTTLPSTPSPPYHYHHQ